MNRFKLLRKGKNLTQAQFAELIHVDQSTVSKWEQDKIIPDIQTAARLADFFGVSIDYLLGREENNNAKQPQTIQIFCRGGESKTIQLDDKQYKALVATLESMTDTDIDPNL